MTIPDFQTLMLPILKALADGQPRKTSEVKAEMVTEYGLTSEKPRRCCRAAVRAS